MNGYGWISTLGQERISVNGDSSGLKLAEEPCFPRACSVQRIVGDASDVRGKLKSVLVENCYSTSAKCSHRIAKFEDDVLSCARPKFFSFFIKLTDVVASHDNHCEGGVRVLTEMLLELLNQRYGAAADLIRQYYRLNPCRAAYEVLDLQSGRCSSPMDNEDCCWSCDLGVCGRIISGALVDIERIKHSLQPSYLGFHVRRQSRNGYFFGPFSSEWKFQTNCTDVLILGCGVQPPRFLESALKDDLVPFVPGVEGSAKDRNVTGVLTECGACFNRFLNLCPDLTLWETALDCHGSIFPRQQDWQAVFDQCHLGCCEGLCCSSRGAGGTGSASDRSQCR